MPERVLTTRGLNRALLARQLLLERSRLPLHRALEQVAGLQAQYAPSPYVALWGRLEGFALADLTRALERRSAVQGTLMRTTIHLVSARDYGLFAAGTRSGRRDAWMRAGRRHLADVDIEAAAALVHDALGQDVKHRSELVELLRPLDAGGGSTLWNVVGAWTDLVRVPPSGTWEQRRADLFATAEAWLGPVEASEEEGLAHLLRRYLGGFGPAPLADAANWAGVAVGALRAAAERLRLRRFRDEEGRELLDLPRASLPPSDAEAPPRFLPTWDATLLAHARRTAILPEPFRPLVFNAKTPHSLSTFLVDGAVAGAWRVERAARKATLVLEPFERLPASSTAPLREEAERLVRFVEADASAHSVRTRPS